MYLHKFEHAYLFISTNHENTHTHTHTHTHTRQLKGNKVMRNMLAFLAQPKWYYLAFCFVIRFQGNIIFLFTSFFYLHPLFQEFNQGVKQGFGVICKPAVAYLVIVSAICCGVGRFVAVFILFYVWTFRVHKHVNDISSKLSRCRGFPSGVILLYDALH
jgi:hypothetical protein